MRKVLLTLAALMFMTSSVSAMPKAQHKITGGAKVKAGFKHLGHAAKEVTVGTVVGAYDTLEAGVDMVGVGLQGVADGLDGLALAVKPVVPPVYYGLHYVYEGLDVAGQF